MTTPQAQVSEDEIISALYRRFKEWSKRGFRPEDVTWCEVKADILKLIEIHSPSPAQPQVTEEMVERGAKALYAKAGFPIAWDGAYEIDKGSYRDKARLVLESALSAPPARQVEWLPIESAPRDKPFLAIRWWEDHWSAPKAFAWQNAPTHDKDVRFVSLDRKYWVREGTFQNGKRELDSWRWAHLPPLPEPPLESALARPDGERG